MCNIEGPGSIDQQQQKKSQIVRSSATPIFNKIWVKLHVFKFHMIVKDLFVPLNLFHLPPFFLVWSLLSSSSCFHLSLLLSFLTSFFYVTSFFPYFFLSLLTSYFPYFPYFFLSFFYVTYLFTYFLTFSFAYPPTSSYSSSLPPMPYIQVFVAPYYRCSIRISLMEADTDKRVATACVSLYALQLR